MTLQEDMRKAIEVHFGTNAEMDAKSDIERNKAFVECFKELTLILERDYQIILQVIGVKNAIS